MVVQADSLCYQTEKQLKEFAEKVPAEVKTDVEAKVASLRAAVDSEDVSAMKTGIDALNQVRCNPLHLLFLDRKGTRPSGSCMADTRLCTSTLAGS